MKVVLVVPVDALMAVVAFAGETKVESDAVGVQGRKLGAFIITPCEEKAKGMLMPYIIVDAARTGQKVGRKRGILLIAELEGLKLAAVVVGPNANISNVLIMLANLAGGPPIARGLFEVVEAVDIMDALRFVVVRTNAPIIRRTLQAACVVNYFGQAEGIAINVVDKGTTIARLACGQLSSKGVFVAFVLGGNCDVLAAALGILCSHAYGARLRC